MIRDAILTRSVPELGEWSGDNMEFIRYVHSELSEAFEYIKSYQRPEMQNIFFEQSFVFFNLRSWTVLRNFPTLNTPMKSFISPLS